MRDLQLNRGAGGSGEFVTRQMIWIVFERRLAANNDRHPEERGEVLENGSGGKTVDSGSDHGWKIANDIRCLQRDSV